MRLTVTSHSCIPNRFTHTANSPSRTITAQMRQILETAFIAMLLVGCSGKVEQPSLPEHVPSCPSGFKIPRPSSEKDVVWDAIGVLRRHVVLHDGEESYKRSIVSATKGQRAIYACELYLSEVSNGGHDQFFFNDSGMLLEDALNGFQLIGAEQHHRILAEVIALFPDSRPACDRKVRRDQMKSMDKSSFDKLDRRLYDLEESFDALATRYIRDHSGEFFTEP